jgi:ELMO domain-containing protein
VIHQPYNKTNPEHEAKLMQLWKAVFPDAQLESRVSEQWKKMGFQGTDPATDFRGMGLLGLQNLIYIAETYPEIFRKIVREQSSRADLVLYPTIADSCRPTDRLTD